MINVKFNDSLILTIIGLFMLEIVDWRIAVGTLCLFMAYYLDFNDKERKRR